MQEKVGSINYAACITRWDVAFAALTLAEYQLNPSSKHLKAADHCLTYLRDTAHYAIKYGGEEISVSAVDHYISFLDISADASFADDITTRKSRQGYFMKCAGGAIT